MALHLLHGPVPVSRQSPIVCCRASTPSLRLKEPDPTKYAPLRPGLFLFMIPKGCGA